MTIVFMEYKYNEFAMQISGSSHTHNFSLFVYAFAFKRKGKHF